MSPESLIFVSFLALASAEIENTQHHCLGNIGWILGRVFGQQATLACFIVWMAGNRGW